METNMKINHPIKYANKLVKELDYFTKKIVKLSYLLDEESKNNLVYHLVEITNYVNDICEKIIEGGKDK